MLDSFATHRAPRASGPSGLIVILAALVGLAGCTGNVAVDGNWAEGTARRGGFANLLVVGVSPDYNQRCAFEQSMAYSLRSSTVQVTTSCAVLGISEPLTRDAVVAAVKKSVPTPFSPRPWLTWVARPRKAARPTPAVPCITRPLTSTGISPRPWRPEEW